MLIAFSRRPLPLSRTLLPFGVLRPGSQGSGVSPSVSILSSCSGLRARTGARKIPLRIPSAPGPPQGCVGTAAYLGALSPSGPTEGHTELVFMIIVADVGLEPQAPLSQP